MPPPRPLPPRCRQKAERKVINEAQPEQEQPNYKGIPLINKGAPRNKRIKSLGPALRYAFDWWNTTFSHWFKPSDQLKEIRAQNAAYERTNDDDWIKDLEFDAEMGDVDNKTLNQFKDENRKPLDNADKKPEFVDIFKPEMLIENDNESEKKKIDEDDLDVSSVYD